jgi:hypothetical protein
VRIFKVEGTQKILLIVHCLCNNRIAEMRAEITIILLENPAKRGLASNMARNYYV